MIVRKGKGKNTATAYTGFLADIAKLANDEWPPGRLLAYAVKKSWLGIYEPKEGYPSERRPQPQQRNGFSGQGRTRDIGLEVAAELAARRERSPGAADNLPRIGPPGRVYR